MGKGAKNRKPPMKGDTMLKRVYYVKEESV
jgi:hypothetical protein